jgi:hypothetical protein
MDPTLASTIPPVSPPLHGANGHPAGQDGRTLPGLFSDLWRGTATLVHEEVELAKADMSEKVTQAAHATGAIAVGGGIAFAGFLVLLLAAANALAMVLPIGMAPWLAPLIVGGVVLIIGLIAISSGRSKLKAGNLQPTRSMQSLRRDQQLVKEHLQ